MAQSEPLIVEYRITNSGCIRQTISGKEVIAVDHCFYSEYLQWLQLKATLETNRILDVMIEDIRHLQMLIQQK